MQTFTNKFVSNEKVNILRDISNILEPDLTIKSIMFLINLENLDEISLDDLLKNTEIEVEAGGYNLHRSPIILEIIRTNFYLYKENKHLIFKLSMKLSKDCLPNKIGLFEKKIKLISKLELFGTFIVSYSTENLINNREISHINLTTRLSSFNQKDGFPSGCQNSFTKKIYYFGNNPEEDLKNTFLKF